MAEELSTKPTILQILPALEQGGVERGTVEIDNALVEAGWNSLVVSSGGKLEAQLKGKHLSLGLKTKNPLKILFNAHLLRFIIKGNKVDIVHARSRAPAWSAYLAVKGTRAKFITTFHGSYNLGGALKRWYNSVMVKGEKIIAVSEYIKDHIIKDYKVPAQKIVTIHRGADLAKFDPAVKPKELNLPKDKKIVMLPGRITRWKGQHIFIEAVRWLDVTGVIIGDIGNDKYKRELEQSAAENIVYLSGTIDLPAVLANADIIVSASTKPEAFGRVIIEAQAMGKPVIATNIGAAPEIIVEGKTGILVPPADVLALRTAIEQLLASNYSELRENCIANAREFSSEKMCRHTLNFYKSLLNHPA